MPNIVGTPPNCSILYQDYRASINLSEKKKKSKRIWTKREKDHR